MAFTLSQDIYTLIVNTSDKDARIAAFAMAFEVEPDTVWEQYKVMHAATRRASDIAFLADKLAKYSIPKTVIGKAKDAAALGCTLAVAADKDGNVTISIVDPKATKGKRGKSKRRYFIDGNPLFDTYRSIAHAMRELGGYDTILSAVGPGNAHKVDSTRWGAKTSLNAWQALQAIGTDAQKARITRTG